ncbi:MAG TPA: glycosyltransferase 87 family protein [Polyangia bacterium]|nr:glycosyltransferase 87 family protein [Polyangia bacterium]
MTSARATIHRTAALSALLLLSQAGYAALVRLDAVNGPRPVLQFLALMAYLFALYGLAAHLTRRLRPRHRGALLVVAAGALLFRLTLLGAGLPQEAGPGELAAAVRDDVRGEAVVYERFLLFDTDHWRYLWDGHVAAHGVNPYRYAPADPALDPLADEDDAQRTDGRAVWSEIRANVNHPTLPTLYPPLAQGVFLLSHALAPGSVLTLKALLVGFDLLAALLVGLTLHALRRPVGWVVLYAWNPLVIKGIAGSGHVDAVAAALLAATVLFIVRGRRTAAAAGWGLAVLAKLTPLVLLPLMVRRLGWKRSALALAIVCAGYLPFLNAAPLTTPGGPFAGLRAFSERWQFNSGALALFAGLAGHFTSRPAAAARALCGLAILGAVGHIAWRDDGRARTLPQTAAATLGALVVLSPAVMPWYLTWILPLAALTARRLWPIFSALVCLAFLVMVDGQERSWALALEYGLLAGLILCEPRRNPQGGPMKRTRVLAVLFTLSLGPAALAQGSGSTGGDPIGQGAPFIVTHSVKGTVVEINADESQLVVEDKKGRRYLLKTNPETAYKAAKKTALADKTDLTLRDFQVGQPVRVQYLPEQDLAVEVRLLKK